MEKSLRELAELVEGRVERGGSVKVKGVAKVEEAKEGEITLAISEKFLHKARQSQASAVIVPLGVKDFSKPVIQVRNPRLAFAQILELADNVYISSEVYLGNNVKIGKGSFIHPRVTILDNTIVGEKVIIHSGTVIGSDGFGFAKKEDGSYYKIPQVGKVVIEDEVEIGANVAIDRATIGETRIGSGCKIDNLVHIAHNVTLGNVAIVGLVGISGSSTIGDGVILAGQAGVTDHVRIGNNTIVAAKSGVTKNIGPNQFVSGFPARPHSKQKRIKAIINQLPQLLERVRKLEKMNRGKK